MVFEWAPSFEKMGVGVQGNAPPSKKRSQNDDNDFFDWNILYPSMLPYYDYIKLVLCLVIVSYSPCPFNSQVHSQNEATALKYLESLTFTKPFL